MNRRQFLGGLAALAAGRLVAAPATKKPNILFIMSDDHTAHAIGAYGGRLARIDPTPNLDAFAREAMVFENCFVTNSICVPSRACIMTGQYSHTNGCYTLGERLAPDHHYLAIEMRKAGYQTAIIGKWHLKEEPNFDYYKVLPGQGSYFDPTFREKTAGQWPRNVVKMTGHSSDCITESTLAWLKRRDRSRPFFLMHHFKAPHDMFDYAPRYEKYLADVKIPEPRTLFRQPRFGSIATRGHNDECYRYIGTSIGRRHAFRNYARAWARDSKLSDDQAKRKAYQTYLKKYLRCVKGVDDSLKRIFDYLKAEGIYDETIIIYTADQGMMLGEHDYQDKRWMYEESMRMPFIIRYPKAIKPGSRTDAIVENVDFAPTILDFAGVPTPAYMQGRSFRRICETGREPADWKKAAYYRYWLHMAHHWNPSHFGIRTKRYKLIFYYGCSMKGPQDRRHGREVPGCPQGHRGVLGLRRARPRAGNRNLPRVRQALRRAPQAQKALTTRALPAGLAIHPFQDQDPVLGRRQGRRPLLAGPYDEPGPCGRFCRGELRPRDHEVVILLALADLKEPQAHLSPPRVTHLDDRRAVYPLPVGEDQGRVLAAGGRGQLNPRPDLRHRDLPEGLAPLSILAVVEVDRLQRWGVEAHEVVVGVVEAEDDARLGVAPGFGTCHQVGALDLLDDGHHALRADQVATLALGGRAVVLPGRGVGLLETILE